MSLLWKVSTLVLALFLTVGAARPAQAAQRIEVGYIPILGSTPLLLIAAEGWAAREGLDLKLTRFDSGPAAIQALVAGKIDVMYAGVAAVMVARASGADISVLATSAVEELAVLARDDLAAAAKGETARQAIHEVFAAKKRKIRIAAQPAGSIPDTVLRYWLQNVAKVDPNEVDIVGMGIDKTEQALLVGAVDAAVVREPGITIARLRDPNATLLARGSEMFPGQPGTVVAARQGFLKDHPDAAEKLIRLHLRAMDVIGGDRPRAARAAQEYIGNGLIELAVTEKALGSPSSKFVADPHAIVGPVEKLQDFERELGVVSTSVPAVQAFDFSFYDAAVGK